MRSLAIVSVLVLAVAALFSCAAPQHSAMEKPASARLVALMPSFADDLCAIRAGTFVVGVSEYTDAPCVRGVPRVNNFSSVNAERVIALHATRVIAIPAQRSMTAPLVRAGIPVTFLSDDSYADVFTDIAVLGDLCGQRASALRLIAKLHRDTAQLVRKARYHKTPSVLFVEQAAPLWTVGSRSYIATLIALAGGRLASASMRRAYGEFSDEALLRAQPDAIVATPDAHIDAVLSREPWRSLRAVQERHVFVVPDPAMLTRPSPRYVEGLSWLIARLSSL